MSALLYAEPELGEYARKCIEVLRSFAPGQEDEVEPAIRLLASIYAKENKDTVEERFKEEYRIYKAAADTIALSEEINHEYNALANEGLKHG